MKKLRNIAKAIVHIWHLPFVKFGVITIVGIVLVGFVGENSLLAHLRHKHYINSLSADIKVYNQRYQDDMSVIRELNHNPKAMERIARERYFMKHDDEDIFVLSDDQRATKATSIIDEHETIE